MTRLLKTILPIILCALFGLSFASPTQAVASLPIVLPALTCDALSATNFSTAVGAKVTINHTEMQTSAQGSWCKVSATIAPEIGVQIACRLNAGVNVFCRSAVADCAGVLT